MFSLWFAFLDGSFVFLAMGPSLLFFVFPLFGCCDLFMIGRVHHLRISYQDVEKNTKPNTILTAQDAFLSQNTDLTRFK